MAADDDDAPAAGLKRRHESWSAFDGDTREICKYGAGCYQRNPTHHRRFKHHPSSARAADADAAERRADDADADERRADDAKRARTTAADAAGAGQHDTGGKVDESAADDDGGGAGGGGGAVGRETQAGRRTGAEGEADNDADGAEDEEEEDLTPEPTDLRARILHKFLVSMPPDFYRFWSFCRHRRPDDPLLAIEDAGLALVGPFEVASGKLGDKVCRKSSRYLTHHRYYFDPPEFQTVLVACDGGGGGGDGARRDGFHVGYFRDDPAAAGGGGDGGCSAAFFLAMVFVAANRANVGCKIEILGRDLFSAVDLYITETLLGAADVDPFKRTKLLHLRESLRAFVREESAGAELDSAASRAALVKARAKLRQSATFHGAGMIVPYDKRTEVGYRSIPETNASLRKICANIVQCQDESVREEKFDVLQELITNVQFANDEGDPGMGLELGLDLLSFGGSSLHGAAGHLLGVAYDLLRRPQFKAIAEAHLRTRRRGKVTRII